jgi:hypothetical protein
MNPNGVVLSALVLLSSAALIGCSDPSSPNIRSFAASDTSLPEGGVDVTFTWDVKNAASLELLPFPGAVSGTSATVNVSETTTFTLVAKKKGRADRESLDIVVGQAFNVSGRLVDGSGRPAADVTVAIGSRVTASDENGNFTFEDVVAPYDLAVVYQGGVGFGGFAYVQLFLGVTRPDPTINSNTMAFGASRSAHIAGTVSGGLPFPNDTLMEVAMEDVQTNGNYLGAAAFDFNYNWVSASPSVNVAVNVVQQDGAGDFSHARLTGTLTDATTLALNPALVDVPERTLTATVANEWGGDVFGYGYYGFNEFNLANQSETNPNTAVLTTAGVLTVVVPDTSNIFCNLYLGGEDNLGESTVVIRDALSSEVYDALVPEPVRMLSPVDGATVGPETQFAVSAQPEMVNMFRFFTGPAAGVPSYNAYVEVYTDETTIAFPDLSDIGLPMPAGTFFNWDAESYGPFASLDEALGSPKGHRYAQGDVYFESEADQARQFVTEGESLGDDDDDVLSASDVRYEPVPVN